MVGLQTKIGRAHRRLKCDGGEGSIHCEQLPEVENFAAVARALQLARGLDDADVRFFVGADQRESYDKVRPLLPRRETGNIAQELCSQSEACLHRCPCSQRIIVAPVTTWVCVLPCYPVSDPF